MTEKLDRDEELKSLKEKADLMGITYSNNIGVDTLRAKVEAKLEERRLIKDSASAKAAMRAKIKDEQLRLVRIRLAVMNPTKQSWRGEIFTVANEAIGIVRKFVPFEAKFYTNGYHVPYCIYTFLRDREYLSITTREINGRIVPERKNVPEFSIEVLPELTAEELAELAKEQAAGNRID